MEMGHAQNTNIRLHQLEDDVRELQARQPVEHSPTTPFIGEAVALSSVSIKEETLRAAILILVTNYGVEKLKAGALTDLASLINSAFDALDNKSKNISELTVGINIDPHMILDQVDSIISNAIKHARDSLGK
ncbi:TPA: hypothetical protein PXN07_004038 [Yersinia enterocolitica]|nr:hypothetical protein [Yersinia enterocolitica]HDL7338731.1 hypothetical protein [Yersinia enterocolitica]